MDIQTYREKKGLTQAEFAAMLIDPPASQGAVSHWETNRKAITAERAKQIEEATGREVTRHDLRPDLFDPPQRRRA